MTKLITQHQLATLNQAELHQLYRILHQRLACSAPGTAERRNCLASLENIGNAMYGHYQQHVTPGPGL
ncbi:hypothetical protein [Emcibacter nanhaiensis]|uniref:Uncharacterized protein n=1 Tax=Emcibacter nanhaiensis TaxID=1505037 RepID=A0A501PSP4_9PROT|nr:hypothetical protein [Emcibacter nanhaiensis]TPD62741.1 hypothetical protein FIV46_01295 [Emcibacter nanhaiensis]